MRRLSPDTLALAIDQIGLDSLLREFFCSVIFDIACSRRFAVAKPPYDLGIYINCGNHNVGANLFALYLGASDYWANEFYQSVTGFITPLLTFQRYSDT